MARTNSFFTATPPTSVTSAKNLAAVSVG